MTFLLQYSSGWKVLDISVPEYKSLENVEIKQNSFYKSYVLELQSAQ